MATSARRGAVWEATGPGAAESGEPANATERQTRLLSEITHELGNYFHKLYYWAEVLREPRAGGADAETAVLLERTVRELETFLKTALEFFRPLIIAPMALRVAELAASVRAVVSRQVEPLSLEWSEQATDAGGTVAVDPGRFSFVLDGMVRRAVGPGATGVAAAVTADAADGTVSVALTACGGERQHGSSVGAAIEWAVLERVVELHGGSLHVDDDPDHRCVTLRLPIRS